VTAARGDQLGPLLRAYLRMTVRGRASQAFAGQLAGKPSGIAWLFVMYVAIGAATLPAILGGADLFTYAFMTQLMTCTMCGLSLTAEAGDALFSPAEPDVLGHRPVEASVLLAAKVIVLFAFSCALAAAQNLLPTMAIASGLGARAAVAHVVVLTLVVGLITMLVTIVYGIAARLVPRERFDDVAAWSQTGLAIAFVTLSLVMPRSAMRAGGIHVDPTAWTLLALPPAWFAGLETVLAGETTGVMRLAVLAVAAMCGVFVILRSDVRVRLAEAMAHVVDERGARQLAPLPMGARWPLRGWLRDPVQRASFQLATAYLRRDRDVRLRLRPSLVVFALLPLAGLVLEEGRGGHLVPLASICLLGMVPGVALEALRISSHPTASELFAIVPISGTGAVFQGARKAAIWYVLPGVGVAILLALLITPGGLPLAVPGVLAIPVFTLIPGLFGPYVPLALPKARGQQAIANAVLLAASTGFLAVIVQTTLAASRRGQLIPFYAGELIVLVGVNRVLRFFVARRGLTTPGASPS